VEHVPDLDETVGRKLEVPRLCRLLEERPDMLLEIDDVERVVVGDAVCVSRCTAGRSELVAHRRVHEVHADDVDDLAPDRSLANPRRLGFGNRLAHAASVARPRPPTANAGAPRRLTPTFNR